MSTECMPGMCNDLPIHHSMHALNLILIILCFGTWRLTDQARTGDVGAHSACHIPSFVSVVNMLPMSLIVNCTKSTNLIKNEQKLFKKTGYIFTTGRFGQTNITWSESSNSDLYANMWFYLGICGNRKLCFTQCREMILRTIFWYVSL